MTSVTRVFSRLRQDVGGDAANVDDMADLRRRLEESEARFAALTESLPQIVWSAPADGEPDFYNRLWYAYTGMPAGSEATRAWTEWLHPEDAPRVLAAWRTSVQTGAPYDVEYRLRDAEGRWRWFAGRAHPVSNVDGEVVRWFGSATDIDELVRARETLADRGAALEKLVSERTAELAEADRRLAASAAEREHAATARRGVDALYEAYIDSTTDGVFVLAVEDGGDKVVAETVNRVVERALGLRRSDVRGLALDALLPKAAADRLTRKLAVCLEAEKPIRYEESVDVLGEERVFEVSLTPVAFSGRMTRVVGSARDLTERRRAEQHLRQAQKMEAVGQLTGGVAHDFNNLLQVVRGNLDLLAHELAALPGVPPTVERRLRDAMTGAERGAKLTRQLLAFSRRQPLAPKSVDVRAMVVGMSELLERTLGETVEVEIKVEDGSSAALVDPDQLENAVLNLAINARDAMPDGGRLTIAVADRADATRAGGGWIEIAVSDTGVGMTAAVLARVYEPFFSTKPEGRGTGLGLPQVQGFIEQSNGRMDIESAPGVGTTVRLRLPLSGSPAAAADEAAPSDAHGRGERVLVLEDDDAVRAAVADLLTALGYEVSAAGSTAEAERLLASDAVFDLLLSDVVMPGQPSPPDFARAARERRPGLKVLFMSGYAEDVVVHQGRIDADVHLIEKPYRKDELAMRLRKLLDERSTTPTDGVAAPAEPLQVLLVEDEPLIAMGLADLLASLGYQVIEAKNAAEAQAAFERSVPSIDIVLTDIGLPDMDGEDLALWCRRTRPGVPIVFSTGQTDFEPSDELASDGRIGVVTKPFNGAALKDALDACRR